MSSRGILGILRFTMPADLPSCFTWLKCQDGCENRSRTRKTSVSSVPLVIADTRCDRSFGRLIPRGQPTGASSVASRFMAPMMLRGFGSNGVDAALLDHDTVGHEQCRGALALSLGGFPGR